MRRSPWPADADIQIALNAVSHRLTWRKVRLLACACARIDWKYLRAEESRRAVALAERWADGLADDVRLMDAYVGARGAAGRWPDPRQMAAATAAALAAAHTHDHRSHVTYSGALGVALAEMSRLGARPGGCRFVPVLRDILPPSGGRPFAPRWLTADVEALARQAYDGRDTGAVPILGDALEDAGCDWPELLAHCREPGRHVRGCWALDAVRGSSGAA